MLLDPDTRLELNGTWWRFEIRPTLDEITAFKTWHRPNIFVQIKYLFKRTTVTNRIWSEHFPDISYYFVKEEQAWYREANKGRVPLTTGK